MDASETEKSNRCWRQGFRETRCQHEGKHEFVPGEYDNQEKRCREGRSDQWENDLSDRLQRSVAVYGRRLIDVLRYLYDKRPQ